MRNTRDSRIRTTLVAATVVVHVTASACSDGGGDPSPTSDGGDARTDATSSGAAPPTGGPPPPATPVTTPPPDPRVDAPACAVVRPPADGAADPRPNDTCSIDADCKDGREGRCAFADARKSCTYHACVSDTDCGAGTEVCGCGLGTGKRNVCLKNSKCRTNTDCPASQFCALSALPGIPIGDGDVTFNGQAWGYFCTTSNDVCRSASDCRADPHDRSCTFSTRLGRWACGGGP